MSTEGRSSEARRSRGGGRNKPWSNRDNNTGGTTPLTRRNSQKGPGRQEFFTDSTNTSYIPSPSPARPLGRPRQTVGSVGGGKSFKAALEAALNNNPRDNGDTASPRAHRRAESTPSVSLASRRSPVQVSELGSPTPNTTLSAASAGRARARARTPSPSRRAPEVPPLVSPASFISESSEPPHALTEIYRRIEDEDLIAEQGNTDDDLSGSVRTSPDTRRKRISGSPLGIGHNITPLSLYEERDKEVPIESGDKSELESKANTELEQEPAQVVENRPISEEETGFGEKIDSQVPAKFEANSQSSGESSPFEEIVETDPEMLARDEKRVKELIKNDLKAFKKAERSKSSLTAENLRRKDAAAISAESSGSHSVSSGRVSEPSLNIPSGWGRKARNNARWMESITKDRSGPVAGASNIDAAGDGIAHGGDGASKSISNWLQTAAATPLTEAGDSAQSTLLASNAGTSQTPERQPFSKAKLWESQGREGSLSPGRQNLALAVLRERSIERLEKSAVATNRLTALGHTKSAEKLVRKSASENSSSGNETDGARVAKSSVTNAEDEMGGSRTIAEKIFTRSSPEELTSQEQMHMPDARRNNAPNAQRMETAVSDHLNSAKHHQSLGENKESARDADLRNNEDSITKANVFDLVEDGQMIETVNMASIPSNQEINLPKTFAANADADLEPRNDSHDLLRRFARATSSSPAPSRSSISGGNEAHRKTDSASPSGRKQSPVAQELASESNNKAGTANVGVLLNNEATSLPPVAQEKPTRSGSPSRIPVRPSATSRTPAVKVGGIYTKTPQVTGAWVDTPMTTRNLDAIKEDSPDNSKDYNVDNLLEAAKAVIVKNSTSADKQRSARELEALAKTAPKLPPSALAAIIEHAKKKNRGEEGSDGEETLQLDESTIQSLEDLLVKEDDELEAGVDDIDTLAGKTDLTDELEAEREEKQKIGEIAQTQAVESETTEQERSPDPIKDRFSRIASVTASSRKFSKKEREDIQDKLKSLPSVPSQNPQDMSKTQQRATSVSKTSSSKGSKPRLSVSIEDPPKLRKKSKGVTIVAPEEECDQAGEFHDFIWPCEACRKRARNAVRTEDEMIGVVQWQTVQVPRLWHWPTLHELYGEKVRDEDSASVLQRLQTWIPRLTLLGWLVLLVGSYAFAEREVTKAYTPPFYAETMVGYGVDAYAPRPPFVLAKLAWRSPLGGPFRAIWLALCVVVRTITGVFGVDAGANSALSRAPAKRWVFREAWEPAIDVGRGVPDVGLGHDQVWF